MLLAEVKNACLYTIVRHGAVAAKVRWCCRFLHSIQGLYRDISSQTEQPGTGKTTLTA